MEKVLKVKGQRSKVKVIARPNALSVGDISSDVSPSKTTLICVA